MLYAKFVPAASDAEAAMAAIVVNILLALARPFSRWKLVMEGTKSQYAQPTFIYQTTSLTLVHCAKWLPAGSVLDGLREHAKW